MTPKTLRKWPVKVHCAPMASQKLICIRQAVKEPGAISSWFREARVFYPGLNIMLRAALLTPARFNVRVNIASQEP